jgi:hypothetical protein
MGKTKKGTIKKKKIIIKENFLLTKGIFNQIISLHLSEYILISVGTVSCMV